MLNVRRAGPGIIVTRMGNRRADLVVASAYVLLTTCTVPFFMADTIGYAEAIALRRFRDFGHLGWYWLGYLFSELLMPVTRPIVGPSLQVNITFTLVLLNWITGLMSVLLMRSLVFHLTRRRGAAWVAAFALMVSQAFLNFTQSGSSYTFGMAFLLLGTWLLVTREEQDDPTPRTALLAGASLFVAVAVWFTYVFSIPAALFASAMLHGFTRRRAMLAVRTGFILALLVLTTFGAAGYSLGIRSFEDAREWVADAAHGVRGMQGIPRAVLGIARSFIDTGNDGPMVKAYLANDPYNPVSLGDILRTSVWRLVLFYGFVAAIAVNLWRSQQGRRVLALLALNAFPVLAFAVMWQGAAIERYLLMYPVFFLAFGCSLASGEAVRLLQHASVAFVALVAVVNLGVMATPVQAAREQAVVDRISPLEPLLLPSSMVAVITQLDEVWAFEWTFPFNRINASRRLDAYHLVEPGTARALIWRELFAEKALTTWSRGGDVWVSRRVQSQRPLREWKWVEGDDPAVSWKDVIDFFAPLDLGPQVGGADGFLKLQPSVGNRARLNEIAGRAGVAAPHANWRLRHMETIGPRSRAARSQPASVAAATYVLSMKSATACSGEAAARTDS